MKRPRKQTKLMSEDEVVESMDKAVHLFPINFETNFRETVAEIMENRRESEKIKAREKKRAERRKNDERVFHITHCLMIEFYKASKVGPPLRKDAGISRRTAIEIQKLTPKNIKKAPGPSTIEKCFDDPSRVERPGAALLARQSVCITLGEHARAFKIEHDRVSFRNAEALLSNIQQSLGSLVTVGELQDAFWAADLCRAKAKEK